MVHNDENKELLLWIVAMWIVPHIRTSKRNQVQMVYTVYDVQEEEKITYNDRS